MLTLHLYGIDHSRAPLEMREGLAFCDSEIREILPSLLSPPASCGVEGAVTEALLLSTCNRTEIYLVIEGEPAAYPLAPLQLYRPGACAFDDQVLRYHLVGREAMAHFLAVAASLRSRVPGDTQIASQIVAAGQSARRARTLGPILEHLVATSLRSAKRVRRETGLMAGNSGIGPAVLQNVRRIVPRNLGGRRAIRVLILGAGAMANEVATHLLRSGGAPGGLAAGAPAIEIAGVWARDRQKASQFGARFGIRSLTAGGAAKALRAVDAVVGACGGRVSLLGEKEMSRCLDDRASPLVVLDLGVPRNLDPAMAGRDGIHLIPLDQIHGQMKERMRVQADAIERSHAILAAELARLQRWWVQYPFRSFRAEVYTSVEGVLDKWRPAQPRLVRDLRVALHRTLERSFESAQLSAEIGAEPALRHISTC